MRVGSQLQRMLRRRERRLLTGRCVVTRGAHPNVETVHEDLPCLVRPSQRATTEVAVGGEQVSLSVYDVRVPYDADLRRGDGITLTRSQDVLQVGEWVTVLEVVVDEWTTSRVAVAHRSRS